MVADLVIPAYNEAATILAVLGALPRRVFRHVVVADNGSTDGTAQLARKAGAVVVIEVQRGYGAACLAGLRWIDQQNNPPDAVAFLDADLSDDPSQLLRLIDPIIQNDADLVIGSRVRFAQPQSLATHQRIGNGVACWLIYLTTGRRYYDLGPMRVIRWSSLTELAMSDHTWGWTVEMQYKAAVNRIRTLELDVPYRRRQGGVSKISGNLVGSVKAGAKIISTIARLAWQQRCQWR